MVAATHTDPNIAAEITKAMIRMGRRAFNAGAAPSDWWTTEMYKGWNVAASNTYNALANEDLDAALAFAEALPKGSVDLDSFVSEEL